jgi:hypothetical protein
MARFKTELEAVKAWVNEWNAIPQSLLEKAYRDEERYEEVVLLAGGTRVCFECDEELRRPTPAECEEHGLDDSCWFCENCGEPIAVNWRGSQEAWPAMWGTVFQPDERIDREWMIANADEIADKCGIHVFECDELECFLAIDGAGYDFYAEHWAPLYRLRGLQWHEKQEKEDAVVERE